MRNLKTQQEIKKYWSGGKPIFLSVICTTYNHESYIEDAIKGFLIQETDFPFEIIIHDDASTDKTPNIVREYHLRYPDIIKPIFQKENQYSKGRFKPLVYASGYSSGKYLALCEGDDYWISKQKLQVQVDAMLEHPEVDFSFHSAYRLRDGIRDNIPSFNYGYNQILYPDSILESVGSFAPTASYILRREVMGNMPEWFYDTAPVGDFFLEMYGAKRGGALYINIPMSIYRVISLGSWSSVMSGNYLKKIKSLEKMLASLQLLKNDFPEYLKSFNKKESVIYYRMSRRNFLAKNDALFQENIENSVNEYSFFSRKQRTDYIFRRMPKLLRVLSKVKYILRYSH